MEVDRSGRRLGLARQTTRSSASISAASRNDPTSGPEYPVDDLPFDPDDAAAFDAEKPAEELTSEETSAILPHSAAAESFTAALGCAAAGRTAPVGRAAAVLHAPRRRPRVSAPTMPSMSMTSSTRSKSSTTRRFKSSAVTSSTSFRPRRSTSSPTSTETSSSTIALSKNLHPHRLCPRRKSPRPTLRGASARRRRLLDDDLDEADFFIGQGLVDEARDILDALLARNPGHPLVLAKLRDLDAGATASTAPAGRLPLDEPNTEEVGGRRAQSVVLEKPLDEEDAETQYNLGLAYREMGLHDEAIKAFTKVMSVPGREVKCRHMIGLCHLEQNNVSEAINQFKAALYVDLISNDEKFGLYYEIGAAYESLNDPQEALYYFEMVSRKIPATAMSPIA